MKLKIVERKFSATDKMKDKVEKKLSKFDKFFGPETEAQVVLAKEKDRETCEITIYLDDTIFRVEETTKDMYNSFDESIENLKKQIRKHKTKLENKYKAKNYSAETFDFGDDEDEVEEEIDFKIVKTKSISVKPMFIEEAILQMNLLNHEFFVFRNAENEEVNIVYKRHDGNYGLIETK